MELIAHERLKRMSAMISGAIAFYEIEGDEIIQGLRQQQKDGLVTGMETMGAALYWLSSITCSSVGLSGSMRTTNFFLDVSDNALYTLMLYFF